MKKIKSSNFELLRIIAIIMIIAHHYCLHGIFNYWHINSTLITYLNNIIVSIVSMGGKLGVDIFVLITGYFMITSSCKFAKVAKLYLTTFIYSILLLIIAYIYGEHHVPSKILNSSLFPFGGNAYWFITTYLMLYVLIPYLNKFILTTKKSMLNSFLIVTTCLWAIIPTFTTANYCFSALAWFIYLYFIGASIRLKSFGNIFNNKELFKKLFIISCIVLVSYAFLKCAKSEVDLWKMVKIAQMQSICIVSIAIYLFHYFKDLKIKHNNFINLISTSVLGIYLFHDNNLVRPFLWQKIIHPSTVMDKPYMFLHLVMVVAIIFVIGVIVDKFITLIFKKHIDKIINALNNINILKRKKYYRILAKNIRKLNKIK